MAHLLAKYLEILPLFLPMSLPMKEVLYKRPYFGVLVFCFKALNKAFSAPKIWIVEAGYLAKVLNEPEWEISLAATVYPMSSVRLGDTIYILFFKYYWISFRNSNIFSVFSHNYLRHWISNSLIYCPIEFLELYNTFSDRSASPHIASISSRLVSHVSLLPIWWANLTKTLLSGIILANSG